MVDPSGYPRYYSTWNSGGSFHPFLKRVNSCQFKNSKNSIIYELNGRNSIIYRIGLISTVGNEIALGIFARP